MKRCNSRPVWGAAKPLPHGIAGFASAGVKHRHDQMMADAGTAAPSDRKIKYYRNPMGLPDTSPMPKKDSMGMDYIPVYEGDDTDDGSVKMSPGKIQRTGVKSEPAAPRTIRSMIHAPGVIQLDERRISVIAMRAESYVQKVENVTTGTHVVKGQPLMEIYSPAVSSAAAEYISTINSKTIAGDGPYGRGSRQRLMNLDVPDAATLRLRKAGRFRSGSSGRRRATASCSNATPSRECAPNRAPSCSGLPTTRWSGQLSMWRSAISVRWRWDNRRP
jgi:hypothetical protein